ncbi:MAG: hypothetical protein J6B55_08060 [Clostridia bacterium]|nr:hypothetical protein [Clostridia bacterium]
MDDTEGKLMKIKYLGTAAAEGMPALFCNCEHCEYARLHGGKDVRTRSQAVIDDTLLIDFPADTYMHVLKHGLPLHKIHHCLITHAHSDHLYPADFSMRGTGFADLGEETEPLNVYGSKIVRESVESKIDYEKLESQGIVKLHVLEAFETYDIDGYNVTPLTARHDVKSGPYIYVIQKDGKTMLYGNDTGIFPDETWEYLASNPVRFDYVSLDCCNGAGPINYDAHMNLERNLVIRARLTELGCAGRETIFCSNHFSHNAKVVLYHELLEATKDCGFLVSYDGMEVEF